MDDSVYLYIIYNRSVLDVYKRQEQQNEEIKIESYINEGTTISVIF